MFNNSILLLKFVTGSHAYNLQNPTSDKDFICVYMQDFRERLFLHRKPKHVIEDNQDTTFIELFDYFDHLEKGDINFVQTLYDLQKNLVYFNQEYFSTIENLTTFFNTIKLLIEKENILYSLNGIGIRRLQEAYERRSCKSLSEAYRNFYLYRKFFASDVLPVYLVGQARQKIFDIKCGLCDFDTIYNDLIFSLPKQKPQRKQHINKLRNFAELLYIQSLDKTAGKH